MALSEGHLLDLENPADSLFFLAKIHELDERKSNAKGLYQRVIALDLKPVSVNEKGLVMAAYFSLFHLSTEEEQETIRNRAVARLATMMNTELLDQMSFFTDHDAFAWFIGKVRDTLGNAHPDLHRILVLYHLERHRRPRKAA